MVLNIILDLLLTALSFLKGAFIYSIPLFILVLIGSFFVKLKTEKKKQSWIISVLITTFIFMIIIVYAMYYFPILTTQTFDLGELPNVYQQTFDEEITSIIYSHLRLIFIAGLLALVLLPIELIGSLIQGSIKKRFPKLSPIINLYLAVYITTLITIILLFTYFRWILLGIIYMIYFGFLP